MKHFISTNGIHLAYKRVVIKAEAMPGRSVEERTCTALSGFGTSPHARGTAVFVQFPGSKDSVRYERYEIESVEVDVES